MAKLNDEDFACDNFVPQKWRKDVCKNCYQLLRLHDKKQKKSSGIVPERRDAEQRSPRNSEPKVLGRLRSGSFDKSLSPKCRALYS